MSGTNKCESLPNREKKTIVALMLPKGMKGYGNLDMIRRVYDPEGLSPAIRTFGGGNTEPKVVVKCKSKRV